MDEVWDFLKRNDIIFEWTNPSRGIVFPFELKPEDFMAFAKEDLKENTERSFVNALSNIKRAIDCRILSLLYFLGVYNKAKKEKWNFPKNADFLLKVGVLSPNILKKINWKRNELEHDFKKPKCEEVMDYFDIASLFLALTKTVLNTIIREYYIVTKQSISDVYGDYPNLGIKLNYEKDLIELEFGNRTKKKKYEIHSNDEEAYTKILKCLVKRSTDSII